MTKSELIKKLSESASVTQKDADAVLAALVTITVDEVKADGDVTIPGIGKISVKDVPERSGIIQMGDKKGETYTVPAHKEPKMKLSKPFKDCLL